MRHLTAALILAGLLGASVLAQQGAELRTTQLRDGTGTVGLPAGWEITDSYRGSVTCTGPNQVGAVVLKMPWTILDPNSAAAAVGGAEHPVARSGDITGALREIVRKRAGGTLRSLRGNRTTGPNPNTPGFHLLYEYTQNGQSMTGLGYFTVLDYGPNQPAWQLYSSAVVAPTNRFAAMLPTMLRIWRSWRPNGLPPVEGSTSALFDRILKDRQLSYEEIQKEFREQL